MAWNTWRLSKIYFFLRAQKVIASIYLWQLALRLIFNFKFRTHAGIERLGTSLQVGGFVRA